MGLQAPGLPRNSRKTSRTSQERCKGVGSKIEESLTNVLTTVVGTEVVSVNVKGTDVTRVDVSVSTSVVQIVLIMVRLLVTVTG